MKNPRPRAGGFVIGVPDSGRPRPAETGRDATLARDGL